MSFLMEQAGGQSFTGKERVCITNDRITRPKTGKHRNWWPLFLYYCYLSSGFSLAMHGTNFYESLAVP